MLNDRVLVRAASRREANRIVLRGGVATLMLSISESGCSQKLTSGDVDVTTYRRRGERDDSQAFERALATGRPVFVPRGEYLVSMVKLPAHAKIHGAGSDSIIRSADPDGYAVFYADSGGPSASVADISIRNLVLAGDVASHGFREHSHLLVLQGVRAVIIENVGFRGFRGDGLMIEGGNAMAANPVNEPRHNREISVRNCWFDGINRDNRNAISIVDGQNIKIENCKFHNVTRPDMPGAIDIEPNPYPFYHIANITVSDCEFSGIGGNIGAISVFVPSEVSATATGLRFVRNRMANYVGTGSDYSIRCANATKDVRNDIRISGHIGQDGQRPYAVLAGNGVTVDGDCRFSTYRSASLIGYANQLELVRDVSIAGRYEKIGFGGRPNQFGLAVFHADGLTVAGDWIDCGDGSADATGVIFLQGASRRVNLMQLVVRAPNRKTVRAIWVASNHRFDRASSQTSGVTGGLPVHIES